MKNLLKFSALALLTIAILSCSGNSGSRKEFEVIAFKYLNVKITANIDPNDAESPKCSFDMQMQYPYANDSAAKKISHALADRIYYVMGGLTLPQAVDSAAKKFVADYQEVYGKFYKESAKTDDIKKQYEFYFNCKSEIENGLYNIVVYKINQEFYEGGAHPMNMQLIMNFNSETGDKITLSDVFAPGYQQKLNEILLNALLKARNAKNVKELNAEGFLVNSDMFATENFILGKEKIIFIYNPYEIAPYSKGKTVLEISYDDVKDILNTAWK